jgi:uncharacterized SAM-binding protein YcdF (DUF218 family)
MSRDAVLILGKELQRDPPRARRELAARAAAASVALRRGALFVATLEAQLAHQQETGSAIVVALLHELGVDPERLVVAEQTRSTREEVRAAADLLETHGGDRLLAITSVYHVPRVRQYLGDHLPEGRFGVYSPECFYRDANPLERSWIEAGAPSTETLAHEGRIERRWLTGAAASRLVPGRWRYGLEERLALFWAAIGDRV